MTGSKHPPNFVVRLVGGGVRPWLVPLRTLTRTLDAVQRLLDQGDDLSGDTLEVDGEQDSEDSQLKVGLQLLDVKSSSAAYKVASSEPTQTLQALKIFGKSLEDPENALWGAAAISSIKDLSDVAKALGCEIEFRLPGKGRDYGDILARVQPTTFTEVSARAFISGRTSVYAKIERVGGATEMHCGIRLPDHPRKMVICHVVNRDLVRQLGQLMYEHVTVSGVATWIRSGWRLKTINIDSFEPPKKGSILETLRRVHKAGGHGWDKVINPDAEIAEMRKR